MSYSLRFSLDAGQAAAIADRFASHRRHSVRILVTGGAGFIGSNLSRRLQADGHDVVIADDFSSGSWLNLNDFRGDILTTALTTDVKVLERIGPFETIF